MSKNIKFTFKNKIHLDLNSTISSIAKQNIEYITPSKYKTIKLNSMFITKYNQKCYYLHLLIADFYFI